MTTFSTPTQAMRSHARRVARALGRVAAQADAEIATVVDTTQLLTQGTVQASAHAGPIRVAGVPQGSVVPGMRIYVRRLQANRPDLFLYAGLAPGLSPMLSGLNWSLVHTTGQGAGFLSASKVNATQYTTTASPNPFLSIPAGDGSAALTKGWFFSFYLFLASLPPAGTTGTICELLSLADGSSATVGAIQYTLGVRITPKGQLLFDTTGMPGGPATATPSTAIFAPHRIWHLVLQAGNGVAANGYTDATGSYNPGGIGPTSSLALNLQTTGNYFIWSFLADHNGANALPAGSWISRFQFGNSSSGSGAAAVWPIATADKSAGPGAASPPGSDAQLPGANGNATPGAGVAIYAAYWPTGAGAVVDQATMAESAGVVQVSQLGAKTALVASNGAALQTAGPYPAW